MSNPTEYVPVRLRQDQLAALDEAVKTLGGNRSEFVRMAVDERLQRLERIVTALQKEDDGDPFPAVPSDQAYHDAAPLSPTDESEAPQ